MSPMAQRHPLPKGHQRRRRPWFAAAAGNALASVAEVSWACFSCSKSSWYRHSDSFSSSRPVVGQLLQPLDLVSQSRQLMTVLVVCGATGVPTSVSIGVT